MGLRINQNIAAMNAYRNLSVTDGQMSKSLEKLSSGFRINRAADDAAGLSISEGLRAQTGGLKVAVRNAQDGISVVQTAEGALTEVHSILQRMRDLAVQANNTGAQDVQAREAAQTELTQLSSELDRIGSTTSFGKTKLLDGTFGNSAANLSGSITGATGGTHTVDGTNDQFTIAGNFQAANGTFVALGATAVTLTNAAYSAGGYQQEMQEQIDTVMTANGLAAGTVKVSVEDNGGGVWKVELSSEKALVADGVDADELPDGSNFTIAGAEAGLAGLRAATSTTTTTGGGTFQVGANNASAEQIKVAIDKVDASALALASLDLVSNASAAIDLVDTAIETVSTQRATLGAYQNRFEHTINNLNVAVENLSASESRIRDTDMAQEMVSFTRSQILSQAGTSMLAQANQAPQSVLSLLRG
jgi:flagellin